MNQAHVSVPALDPETMTDEERKALAYDTLDHIKAHPETWNQGEWRCRTGMCYAGWLVTLAGGTWLYPKPAAHEYRNFHLELLPDEDAPYTYGKESVHVMIRASALLGPSVNPSTLFSGANSIEMIEEQLNEAFGGRP